MGFKITSLADIERLESQPYEQWAPERSVYEIFRNSAERFPEHTALIFLPSATDLNTVTRISFAELFRRITAAANLFHRLGVGPHDAVGFLLPILPETHYVLWGAETAGIACPVNPFLSVEQLADLFQAAEAKVLVASPVLMEKAQAVHALVPGIRHLLQVGAPVADGILDFVEELERSPSDRLISGREIQPDDVAAYFHTGGTTASPKLAQHTHRGQVFTAHVMPTLFATEPGDIWVNGFPLFHVAGSVDLTLGPLAGGATVLVTTASGNRNPEVVANFWKILAHFRVTVGGGVPTTWCSVVNVPIEGADLSAMKVMFTGAAPMPTEIAARLEKLTGVSFHEVYGMTETSGIASIDPAFGKRRLGSAGFRLPYEQIRIVRLLSGGAIGEDSAPNETGLLLMRGPNVIPGYKDARYNPAAFTPDGWLITGDLGYFDQDQYLFINGRAKDLIIRGGHNIDPVVIEDVLAAHPGVECCAAIGQPDAYAGELPVAYVQLKAGVRVEEEELVSFAAANLPERAAVPKRVIVTAEMPVTAVGKIFKPELRRRCAEETFRRAVDGLDVTLKGVLDPRDGLRVDVSAVATDLAQREALQAEITRRLGAFTVKHALVWA